MKTDKSAKNEIKAALDALGKNSAELIDFDTIRQILERYSSMSEELDFLKTDYRRRMIGMLKAVVAVSANDDDSLLAARLADDETDFTAEELVKLYGRTAARFRKNFPASFQYLSRQNLAAGQSGWQDYKV